MEPEQARKTQSAGGVVINTEGDVLVVSQHGDSWSLPKGHIDLGETPQQAAAREIREESGIGVVHFIKELGSYERYKIGKGGVGEDKSELKHIAMFLFTTSETILAPEDPDNPEARWVPPAQVASILTHPQDQAFFRSIIPEIIKF